MSGALKANLKGNLDTEALHPKAQTLSPHPPRKVPVLCMPEPLTRLDLNGSGFRVLGFRVLGFRV